MQGERMPPCLILALAVLLVGRVGPWLTSFCDPPARNAADSPKLPPARQRPSAPCSDKPRRSPGSCSSSRQDFLSDFRPTLSPVVLRLPMPKEHKMEAWAPVSISPPRPAGTRRPSAKRAWGCSTQNAQIACQLITGFAVNHHAA